MLQDGAAKDRRSRSKSQSSLLCGKLFDETGDRLTLSHTKTRLGKRLRYYISHRLIAKSGEKNLDGWRLPTPELEAQVAALTLRTLTDASAVTQLMTGASTGDIGKAKAVLTNWLATATQADLLSLARKITSEPGQLTVQIDQNQVADILKTNAETLNEDAISIRSVFQIRKRGVETKLIFADMPIGQDDALIRNIAKAHTWFEQMKGGMTFAQIAVVEKTSKRRVQQMIDFAFLVPDIVRDVLEGKQPIRFTSDWCLRHALPSEWDEQRQLLKSLQ
jgi:site-specific DNA recombinase